jgi:hypothetical protein
MLRLAAVISSAALCWTLVTAGSFDDVARTSVAPRAAGAAASVQVAQFNPCPNGKCR